MVDAVPTNQMPFEVFDPNRSAETGTETETETAGTAENHHWSQSVGK